MPGPTVRTDIVDVYVFRRPTKSAVPRSIEFLQLRRCQGTLANSWQPVMGHITGDESATDAAVRELAEETGYARNRGLLQMWQLEMVSNYFLAQLDAIIMSPCFAVHVDASREPKLDAEHDAARWVPREQVDSQFMWPSQRRAVDEIVRDVLTPDSLAEPALRIDMDGER